MPSHVKLLLTENVESLGIVGDIVRVREGHARNYLLPFGYATEPSDDLISALAERRAQAEKDRAKRRAEREDMIGKLDGQELTLVRACNDQGHLYGSVTQQDIAEALSEVGFEVQPREVRLSGAIKRVSSYDVLVKVDADLEANIKLWVEPDRDLELDEDDEMEFDNEGELVVKGDKPKPGPGTGSRPDQPAPDAPGTTEPAAAE